MAAYYVDPFIEEKLKELENDPRELKRYKDFSVYADLLPFIPINIKAYIQSQLGINKPITELDLTDKEIAELDQMIFEQGLIDPSKISYEDYQTESGYSDITRNVPEMAAKAYKVSREEIINNPEKYTVGDPVTGESITLAEAEKRYPGILSQKPLSIEDFKNPAFNLKTFLGKADILVDENGNVIVEDIYDFGSPELNIKERKNLEGVGLGENPIYEAARRLPLYNPLNIEYPVNIDLGTKEEYQKRINKAEGDEVRSEIDEDLEALLSGKGSLAEDPLYKLSMMVVGPSGKFKAADIVADFFKHQRIQSLLKSGAPGDITEIKQIQKGLKIKNPAEAEKLYMDLQNKGKELASPEDIQRAIEEFLKK